MEDNGCPKCSLVMKERGSDNLCIDCQIEYYDWQASMAMRKVEELKKKRDKEKNDD